MALELLITFRDPKRKKAFHPFSFQVVLKRAWWPLANRLGLPLLQQLECLELTRRADAEQLVRELGIVRDALLRPEVLGISEEDAAYILKRIGEVVPLVRGAIQEWDDVDSISL
jgi:hypothetical protein